MSTTIQAGSPPQPQSQQQGQTAHPAQQTAGETPKPPAKPVIRDWADI